MPGNWNDPRFDGIRIKVGAHLDKISKLFKDGVKVTCVFRNPNLADGDVVVTDDSVPEVIKALRKLEGGSRET